MCNPTTIVLVATALSAAGTVASASQSRKVASSQKHARARNLRIQVEAGNKASALSYKANLEALDAEQERSAQEARLAQRDFRKAHSALQVRSAEAGVGGGIVDEVAGSYARQNAQYQADRSKGLEFAELSTFNQMLRIQEEQRLGTLGALGGPITDPSTGILLSGLAKAGLAYAAAFSGGSDSPGTEPGQSSLSLSAAAGELPPPVLAS